MSSLLEIKNQISATKGTKKITRAMQLVAASKMKTFQKTSESVRDYTKDLLASLFLSGRTLASTSFAQHRTGGKVLFVLLTSDKGLCGAMNTKLIRSTFEGELWNATPISDRLLITVGRKGAEAARVYKAEVTESFPGLTEQLETIDALKVVSPILNLWQSGEVKQVVLIAPEYVNPFVFHTEAKTYLPLKEALTERLAPEGEAVEAAFFEPAEETVVEQLARKVVESLFIEAFFQLKATEYSSRMVAMKKATEAADEKITSLTNIFNKLRQSVITQQLSELAAANEAMSSEYQYETFEV